MRRIFFFLTFSTGLSLMLFSCKGTGSKIKDSGSQKPNIVFILSDDMGYSDVGAFGSEIKTPNIDRLADEGIRFANFYNMAKCEPSRSTLFTGLYEGGENAVNFLQILRNSGYYVIHSGKEHWMKWAPDHVLAKNISDQSLTFKAMNEFFEPPSGKFTNPFILNGETVKGIEGIYHEQKPFFKTDALTDNALRWLEEPVSKGQPFFLFMGYGAAHYPLQARPEDIAKYRGTYKKGWDRIREERMERLKKIGLFPEDAVLSPPSANINRFRGHPKGDEELREKIPLYRPWEELDEQEKDDLDLEMAVFAAMVDRMDQNIGRLMEYLDKKGITDNTIVIYMSDNGSCPYDSNRDFKYPPGVAEGFRTLCAAWANAGNTPFRYFKQYGHEGGTQTHFIMRWPARVNPGTIARQQGHIIDLAPTLLEAAGVEYPAKVGDMTPQPLQGSSLMPVLTGKEREEPEFFMSGWTDRFRMFRMGDYKIVKANGEAWELYNMKEDPTELNNLAEQLPGKVNEMEKAWIQKQEDMTKKAGN